MKRLPLRLVLPVSRHRRQRIVVSGRQWRCAPEMLRLAVDERREYRPLDGRAKRQHTRDRTSEGMMAMRGRFWVDKRE